jgi:Leucine-rich repeat (LRR) protein
LRIDEIDKLCPELQVLDIGKNRVFTIEAVEILHKLHNLSEVNFKDNPICAHKHLKQMVQDVVPDIEIINGE